MRRFVAGEDDILFNLNPVVTLALGGPKETLCKEKE